MRALILLLTGCSSLVGGRDKDNGCTDPLICSGDLSEECTGELTTVAIPLPGGCEDIDLSHDIPEEGFALGESSVQFTDATGGQSCALQVVITDETSPELSCEPVVLQALSSPDEIAEIPVPEFSDLCDLSPSYQASLESLESGANTVVYEAWDASGNTTSCTSEITVQELFPAEDLQVLSAALEPDGSTSILLGWTPSSGAHVLSLRLEQAESEDGPWTEIDTLDSDTLSTALPDLTAPTHLRLTSLSDELEGGSSESIQVFPIAAIGYDEREIDVDRVPFPTTLYGVVRHPSDLSLGPFPLVLLLHGNHGNCRPSEDSVEDSCATSRDHECPWSGWVTTPNAEGMAFQAETLAAQGYVAVSISGNAMNCRDDYILERSELIIEHLRHWRDWNDTDGGPLGSDFVGALDMERVGLVGHSRGGDAVSNVPAILQASPEAGIAIESVFAIAPTDFHSALVLDTHYATLLPACDGDVATLSGREIYDRSVQDGNPVVMAQALYMGANHNYFSTEWAYNDGSWVCSNENLVGKQAQQGWLEATLGPWFGTTLEGRSLRPDIQAEAETSDAVEEWAGRDLDIRWSYSSDDRLRIDDLEGPGAPDTNLLGEANELTGFITARHCEATSCGNSFDHEKSALVLKWADDGSATALFGLGGMDLTDFSVISFRISSRNEGWNSVREVQDAWLVLQDSDGDEVSAQLSDIQRISHGYDAGHDTDILQTVRLDLTKLSLESSDLDLGSIGSFSLQFPSDGLRGSIYLSDLELSR
jgi:hypothetical protein